jgi:energy-coupling factor transport system ATP-binding protein
LSAEKLCHAYDLGLPSQRQSLSDIDITIYGGSVHALIGPSGSGKTTLAEHFNALLKPSQGRILLDACDIWTRELTWVRRRVGLVFQFPELQLFAETVEEDVAFGPRNMGYDEARTDELITRALAWVDLPREHFGQRSPLALSGGERRRAALAGVLAMDPEVLVLDEPTAGLDPRSTQTMCQLFEQLAAEGKSLLLIAHDMDLVAQLADYVTALNDGKITMQGPARHVLTDPDFGMRTGLNPPTVVQLAAKLRRRGIELTPVPLHVKEIDNLLS